MVLGSPSSSESGLSPNSNPMFLSLSQSVLLAVSKCDRLIPSHLHRGLSCHSPLLPSIYCTHWPLASLLFPSWPLLLKALCLLNARSIFLYHNDSLRKAGLCFEADAIPHLGHGWCSVAIGWMDSSSSLYFLLPPSLPTSCTASELNNSP